MTATAHSTQPMTIMMKNKRRHGFLAALLAVASFLASLLAGSLVLAAPAWSGGTETTMQRFDFTDAATETTPEVTANPLGLAEALIDPVSPPSSGWQDPSKPFTTPGINGGDGAWELGVNGYIQVVVPVAPEPPSGLDYFIDFHIEVVYYEGLPDRPDFAVLGKTVTDLNEVDVFLQQDGPLGSYRRVTWTGVIPEVLSDPITMQFLSISGALIDSIEIHTRYRLNRLPATVTLNQLSQTYDGSPRSVSVVTDPPGLDVVVTYDGSTSAPTNAGSYDVEAIIVDALYEGSATGTLEIAKAAQSLSFPPIANQLTTDTVTLSATGGASGEPVVFAVTSGPGVISGGNTLSFTGAGSVTVTASQAGNANYLAAPSVPQSLTVTKASATVSITGLSQTYDGNPKSVTVATTPAGLNVVVTYDGESTPPTDAGSYAVVATIDDAIYQGSSTRAFTINKAAQSINFPVIPDQTADATVNLSATGGGSGNPVTFEVTTGPATLTGNVLTFTGAGAVAITASQAGDDNYLAADLTRTFAVTKAATTIQLKDLAQVYDGTPKPAGATTTPAGLTVNFTYDGSATPPTAAGSYAVVATIDDPIYQGTASGSLVIDKAEQVIDFPAIPDQLTTDTVTLTATGGASGEPVAFTVNSGPAVLGAGNVLSFTGAGTVSVTATQAGNANYKPASAGPHTFTVSKAPASVTLASLNHVYDGAAKAATATTTPLGLTVAITYDGSATAPKEAGDYAVVATINDLIYEGSATGTLSIAKASQTISFPAIPNKLTTDTVTLTATGGASGEPVTYVVSSGPAVLGAGNVLSFTGAGTVSVTASQAGNANYEAAPSVMQSISVSKATATVNLTDLSATYDGTPQSASATTTPADLAVILTYDGDAAAPVNAGDYAVVATIDDPIYEGTASGTFSVAKAAQSIVFAAIPDQVVSSVVNLTATGGGSGNPVTFGVTSGPGVISGGNVLTFTTAGTVTVTASQAGGPNHLEAAPVSHSFVVSFTGYDAWRDQEYPGETDFAIIGFTAKPYGSALANGFRYYLGNSAQDPTILTAHGEDSGAWVFTHRRVEPAREDVAAVYEWSTDLVNWQAQGESFAGTTVNFALSAGAPDANDQVLVELRATPSGAPVDRLFVRLKLIFPAPLNP